MEAKKGLLSLGLSHISRLQEEGRYSTAHVYENAVRSFLRFSGSSDVPFSYVTRERLRSYSEYLYSLGLKPNTVSTYMRMLRSLYNQGVSCGAAPYVPRLFRDVYTGVDVRRKKALRGWELRRLLYGDPGSETLRLTQSIGSLLFQFCGMPFVDFAHLEKSALRHDVLRYRRVKTRSPMSVEVLDSAKALMERLLNARSPSPGCPDYLFPVLRTDRKSQGKDAYREYQSALRKFNNRLKRLARALHIDCPVTSYTFRHSWATTAKYRGVPIEMISESLGHTSVRTTQIYLKGFDLRDRTEVNRLNLRYIEKSVRDKR